MPGEGALFAELHTTLGVATLRLHEQETPVTVANFVGLATGSIPWVDPIAGCSTIRPLYEGTEVLRALPDLLVHFGDPTNSGRGGPGYRFENEFVPTLRHDRAGVVSMANSGSPGGEGTNGSQFFVLLDPRPDLDDSYTVFGEIVEGLEVLRDISRLASDLNDRPLQRCLIDRVCVRRSPAD